MDSTAPDTLVRLGFLTIVAKLGHGLVVVDLNVPPFKSATLGTISNMFGDQSPLEPKKSGFAKLGNHLSGLSFL